MFHILVTVFVFHSINVVFASSAGGRTHLHNMPCFIDFVTKVMQNYDKRSRFGANKFATFGLWQNQGSGLVIHQNIPDFMGEEILENWQKKSADHQKLFKQYLHRADKNKVLKALPDLHEEAFAKIDCLQCANCCKNYSPRFKTPDIKRISKYLKMKEGDFINRHLFIDSEGDYVVRTKPCSFLGTDNYCTIYEVRPSDCQRFPYTDEDVLLKRQTLTLKNSTFCPIVYFVLEKLIATTS